MAMAPSLDDGTYKRREETESQSSCIREDYGGLYRRRAPSREPRTFALVAAHCRLTFFADEVFGAVSNR